MANELQRPQTDVRNAGGTWVDNKKLIEEFAEGRHEAEAAQTKATAS